jgi:hypothetical protein
MYKIVLSLCIAATLLASSAFANVKRGTFIIKPMNAAGLYAVRNLEDKGVIKFVGYLDNDSFCGLERSSGLLGAKKCAVFLVKRMLPGLLGLGTRRPLGAGKIVKGIFKVEPTSFGIRQPQGFVGFLKGKNRICGIRETEGKASLMGRRTCALYESSPEFFKLNTLMMPRAKK